MITEKKKHQIKKSIRNKRAQDDSDDSGPEEKIPNDQIDYNAPKPGPHAKAGEWRKWKQMKRQIRQEREERRMIKRQKMEEETKKNTEIHKNLADIKKMGRNFTLSVAIPGSIIGNVQSKELKTYVTGQIARATTLFCVDEIVVYNDYALENDAQNENNQQLIKILEYVECPQYLRRALFPTHRYLEHVGLLNAIEAPHHFKKHDEWNYREGVVTDIPSKEGKGSWVDIGLYNKIQVDRKLKTGVRVTVKKSETSTGKLTGLVVSPDTPRTEDGTYWGYQVRYASAFRKILHESPYEGGYDLKICVDNKNLCFKHLKQIPKANHVLVVFGGIQGIGAAIEADEKLRANKAEQIFSHICESAEFSDYGSRSIRLEESLLISLSYLRQKILEAWENDYDRAEVDSDKDSKSGDESDERFEDIKESSDEEQEEEEEEEDTIHSKSRSTKENGEENESSGTDNNSETESSESREHEKT